MAPEMNDLSNQYNRESGLHHSRADRESAGMIDLKLYDRNHMNKADIGCGNKRDEAEVEPPIWRRLKCNILHICRILTRLS